MITHQTGPLASANKANQIALKSFALGSWATAAFGVAQSTGGLEYADSLSMMIASGQLNNLTSGSRPAFQTSINGGTSWTARYLAATTSIYGFLYVPQFNKFFAGTTTTQALITSTDGVTFTETTLTNFRGGDFAYSPELGRLVSVGTSYINYTDNGTSWTATAVAGSWISITWCNKLGMFIACTTNGFATSSDGITWSATTNFPSGLGAMYSFAWSDELGTLIVVGQSGTAYSRDLVNFYVGYLNANAIWMVDCKWVPELGMFVVASCGSSPASSHGFWYWSRDGMYFRKEAMATSDFWFDVEFDLQNQKLMMAGQTESPYSRTDNLNTMSCTLLAPQASALAASHMETYPTSIQDPSFENATLSTSWTVDGGATSTTSQTINSVAAQGAQSGSRFMEAGVSTALSVVSQLVSLTTAMVNLIDSGTNQVFILTWYQAGGSTTELDTGHVSVIWYDWQHRVIEVDYVLPRACKAWTQRTIFNSVPSNARYYRLEICSIRKSGTPLNQFYDNFVMTYTSDMILADTHATYAITGPANNQIGATGHVSYVLTGPPPDSIYVSQQATYVIKD